MFGGGGGCLHEFSGFSKLEGSSGFSSSLDDVPSCTKIARTFYFVGYMPIITFDGINLLLTNRAFWSVNKLTKNIINLNFMNDLYIATSRQNYKLSWSFRGSIRVTTSSALLNMDQNLPLKAPISVLIKPHQ